MNLGREAMQTLWDSALPIIGLWERIWRENLEREFGEDGLGRGFEGQSLDCIKMIRAVIESLFSKSLL